MSEEEMEELKECFHSFDENGDGFVDIKELGVALRSMGQNPTEKELEDIMNQYDTDGNKKIDFEEFATLFGKCSLTDEENRKELKSAFDSFDENGDHYIDLEELKKAMTTLGEPLTNEEADDLLNSVDKNNDGKINYIEFLQMMQGK